MESSQYLRASRTISRYEAYDTEESQDIDVQQIQEPPASSNDSIDIDQVLINVMKQIDVEIHRCIETGQSVATLLRRRWTSGRGNRAARTSRCREQPQDTNQSSVDDQNSGIQPAPRKLDWTLTPHVVSVRRGMRDAPTLHAFDDTRLRQAYSTAIWRQRAEKFHISLDMEDPSVQETMQHMQDLAFM